MTLGQICEKLKESKSISELKDLQYDSLENDHQVKLEGAIIYMLIKFRNTPTKLGTGVPIGLYKRVDSKWKLELTTKKKIRKTTLEKVMPDLGKRHVYGP